MVLLAASEHVQVFLITQQGVYRLKQAETPEVTD